MSSDAMTSPSVDAVTVARAHGLGDVLRRSAARHPGKVAIVDGERRFTYAEFDATVNRIAAVLAGQGLRRGDRLALLSHNCWQFAALNFASARLGLVLVPLNFMLTAAEIAYILGHCEPSGFVAEESLLPVARDACERAGVAPVVRARIRPSEAAGVPDDGGRWGDVVA